MLSWMAFYVVFLSAACWAAGKLADLIPILTHLISGFSGAAFAVLRIYGSQKEKAVENRQQPTPPEA